MSDAKVSPIVGQEVWAAVSVVFCVAVILVFFFILCCAYRRHRRVRDLAMFTAPVLDELGTHSAPWLVSNAKQKHEPDIKRTSGVWRGGKNSLILVECSSKLRGLKHLSDNTKEQRKRWFMGTTFKKRTLKSTLFKRLIYIYWHADCELTPRVVSRFKWMKKFSCLILINLKGCSTLYFYLFRPKIKGMLKRKLYSYVILYSNCSVFEGRVA